MNDEAILTPTEIILGLKALLVLVDSGNLNSGQVSPIHVQKALEAAITALEHLLEDGPLTLPTCFFAALLNEVGSVFPSGAKKAQEISFQITQEMVNEISGSFIHENWQEDGSVIMNLVKMEKGTLQ